MMFMTSSAMMTIMWFAHKPRVRRQQSAVVVDILMVQCMYISSRFRAGDDGWFLDDNLNETATMDTSN